MLRKIISLFQRNYDGDRLVRDEIVPGAEWVAAGEGVATIKFDGTSCLWQNNTLYKRYDAKGGKTPPPGFIPAQDADPVTGHLPGWLAVGEGPEDRWHRAASVTVSELRDGWTYELVGPKIQTNPHRLDHHQLWRHGSSQVSLPRDFAGIRDWLTANRFEGIVWWQDITDPECAKVKIKSRDFGIVWPSTVKAA